jgi:hypothetical protein
MKSPLDKKTWQVVNCLKAHVLWHWPVSLLSQKKKKKDFFSMIIIIIIQQYIHMSSKIHEESG